MSAKYLPQGTTFSFNSKTVGGLITIGIPDRSRGEAETTDSDSGPGRTFLPALRNPGTVGLTFRHDPSDDGQLELEANFLVDGSAALKTCVITLPTGRTYTFTGFVTEPPRGELALVNDAVAEQSATIRVIGAVTISG